MKSSFPVNPPNSSVCDRVWVKAAAIAGNFEADENHWVNMSEEMGAEFVGSSNFCLQFANLARMEASHLPN